MQSTTPGPVGTDGDDSKKQDFRMKELAELERRISTALTRIGDGLAALPDAHAAKAVSAEPVADHSAELAELRGALDAERAARIAAEERLAAAVASTAASGDAGRALALQEQVDRLTKLLDVQGLDLVRLRKTVGTLRESLQSLRSAQVATLPDTAAINRALLAEVDAMRAERQSEMAELDEIIAELDPLLQPVTTEEGRDNG
jgi:chromosome segregation ATPase